jgi:hypothetical protein
MDSKTIQRETEKQMHIVLFVLLEAYECKVLKITARVLQNRENQKPAT